jgi:hypothetical protein
MTSLPTPSRPAHSAASRPPLASWPCIVMQLLLYCRVCTRVDWLDFAARAGRYWPVAVPPPVAAKAVSELRCDQSLSLLAAPGYDACPREVTRLRAGLVLSTPAKPHRMLTA